jgi:putative ABC transport system ATP-binding protein
MRDAVLTVRDLTMEYGSGGYRIRPLDELSLTAQDGELVVVLGPSGCGKTTLLSCLAGLLTPTAGSVHFGGVEVTALRGPDLAAYRRRTVGIVFQAFNLVPSLTARENVMAPLILTGERDRQAGRRAAELLDQVGLTERAGHRPAKLSGGQQQRVAIARALVHDPSLLLADEPTAHLDHIQVEGVLELLRGLAVPGRMVVVSTHDDRITRLADRVIELTPRSSAPPADAPVAITLTSGDLLFSQGDASELVYVVEEGSVELFREREEGEPEVVASVGPGSYFGELGPLLRMPRSSSARATCETRLTGYPPHIFSRRFPTIRAGRDSGV